MAYFNGKEWVSSLPSQNKGLGTTTEGKIGNTATTNTTYKNKYGTTTYVTPKTTTVEQPQTYGNTGDTGNTGNAALSQYYQQLLSLFEEQNENAKQSALDSIMANLKSVKGTYKNQIQSVYDEYNNLINENELKKERARQVVRENQANRGQLDSGLGRQEQLQLNSTYDNATTNLQSARTQAINDIYSLIAQAEAEANTNKANVENQYANALLQWKLANA